MKKLGKTTAPGLLLLSAIISLAVGILILVIPEIMVSIMFIVIAVLILLSGISSFFCEIKQDKKGVAVLTLLLHICIAGAVIIFYYFFLSLANLIAGIVIFIVGGVKAIMCLQLISEKIKGVFRFAFSSLVHIVFGILMIVYSFDTSNDIFVLLLAIYLIVYSFTLFVDFFAELFCTDYADKKLKKHFRIAVPNIIATLVPNHLINSINEYFKQNEVSENAYSVENGKSENDKIDLEVFIHMSEEGFGRFGHADLCFGDKIYSYGCYDEKKHKLFGMLSQGTLATAPREKYIQHCLKDEKKYLVGFGFTLSEEQKEAVRETLDKLMTLTEPFESDYEKAIAQGGTGDEFKDPASALVRSTGGKVYYVVNGPFKNYFAVSTNCVQLADLVTGSTGIDAIPFNGIRTPGAYYLLLDDLFKHKNTIVVKKTLYIDKDNVKDEKKQ